MNMRLLTNMGKFEKVLNRKFQFSCSTDLNIVAHPYYDTYHDIVRVHAHAFKLPDHTRLSIRCDFQICTEIKDEHGKTSCQEIGTVSFNLVKISYAIKLNLNFIKLKVPRKIRISIVRIKAILLFLKGPKNFQIKLMFDCIIFMCTF
jgi:hypothetical protein